MLPMCERTPALVRSSGAAISMSDRVLSRRGISMVATTFSTDTPNLVTETVRTPGVAGNWRCSVTWR